MREDVKAAAAHLPSAMRSNFQFKAKLEALGGQPGSSQVLLVEAAGQPPKKARSADAWASKRGGGSWALVLSFDSVLAIGSGGDTFVVPVDDELATTVERRPAGLGRTAEVLRVSRPGGGEALEVVTIGKGATERFVAAVRNHVQAQAVRR